MTNFEKIKQMSVEEMAEFLDKLTRVCMNGCNCDICPIECLGLKQWLESEVQEDE